MSRIIFIGESNSRNLAGVVKKNLIRSECFQFVNLAVGGFIPSVHEISKMRDKMDQIGIQGSDIIVGDLFANMNLLSNNCIPTRGTDGKFHIHKVSTIDDEGAKDVLDNVHHLLDQLPQLVRIIITPPAPRYLSSTCCSRKEHMSDIETVRKSMFSRNMFMPGKLAASLVKTYKNTRCISYSTMSNLNHTDSKNLAFFRKLMSKDDIHFNEEGLKMVATEVCCNIVALTTDSRCNIEKARFSPNRVFVAADEKDSQSGLSSMGKLESKGVLQPTSKTIGRGRVTTATSYSDLGETKRSVEDRGERVKTPILPRHDRMSTHSHLKNEDGRHQGQQSPIRNRHCKSPTLPRHSCGGAYGGGKREGRSCRKRSTQRSPISRNDCSSSVPGHGRGASPERKRAMGQSPIHPRSASAIMRGGGRGDAYRGDGSPAMLRHGRGASPERKRAMERSPIHSRSATMYLRREGRGTVDRHRTPPEDYVPERKSPFERLGRK